MPSGGGPLRDPPLGARVCSATMSPPRPTLHAAPPRRPPLPCAAQYNMVKLIPAKEHSEMFGQYREPTYEDWLVDDE